MGEPRKLLDIVHHQLESKKKLGSKAQGQGQGTARGKGTRPSLSPCADDEEEAGERKPPDMEV